MRTALVSNPLPSSVETDHFMMSKPINRTNNMSDNLNTVPMTVKLMIYFPYHQY